MQNDYATYDPPSYCARYWGYFTNSSTRVFILTASLASSVCMKTRSNPADWEVRSQEGGLFLQNIYSTLQSRSNLCCSWDTSTLTFDCFPYSGAKLISMSQYGPEPIGTFSIHICSAIDMLTVDSYMSKSSKPVYYRRKRSRRLES